MTPLLWSDLAGSVKSPEETAIDLVDAAPQVRDDQR